MKIIIEDVGEIKGYQIRQCVRDECGLRYPLIDDRLHGERCPRCGASTRLLILRPLEREHAGGSVAGSCIHLEILLDNLRSAWNVGSIFRTADGLGIQGLYLCGFTPTPENPKVTKTSLGAERSVPWSYHPDGVCVAHSLREQGYRIWALEHDRRAVSLLDEHFESPIGKVILAVGNEITGVDPGILELCEKIIYIPMQGAKRSLNVAVAFGIAASYFR